MFVLGVYSKSTNLIELIFNVFFRGFGNFCLIWEKHPFYEYL